MKRTENTTAQVTVNEENNLSKFDIMFIGNTQTQTSKGTLLIICDTKTAEEEKIKLEAILKLWGPEYHIVRTANFTWDNGIEDVEFQTNLEHDKVWGEKENAVPFFNVVMHNKSVILEAMLNFERKDEYSEVEDLKELNISYLWGLMSKAEDDLNSFAIGDKKSANLVGVVHNIHEANRCNIEDELGLNIKNI